MSEDPSPEDDTVDMEELGQMAADLTALSNDNRLQLLHLLTEPRYAEEIADALDMSRQSALKHVDKLVERGFVRLVHGQRSSGPVKEYVTVPQRLFALGVRIGDMGKLKPEGGPQERRDERTMAFQEDGTPVPEAADAGESEAARHLLILTGPRAGERYALEGQGPRWSIGRDEDRDLTIGHDPYVSAHHAEVHLHWRGLEIVDAFSSNGTRLNFKRIPKGGRVPLRVGDVIGVGHTQLVFQTEDQG